MSQPLAEGKFSNPLPSNRRGAEQRVKTIGHPPTEGVIFTKTAGGGGTRVEGDEGPAGREKDEG